MKVIFFSLGMFWGSAHAVVNGIPLQYFEKPEIIRLNISRERTDEDQNSVLSEEACSAVAISHDLVLTAGHCLAATDLGVVSAVFYPHFNDNQTFNLIGAIKIFTQFQDEKYQDERTFPVTQSCSPEPMKLPTTKTLDLGIARFPPYTFSKWLDLDLSPQLDINDSFDYFGYGIHVNGFAESAPFRDAKPGDLRFGSNIVWKKNSQRIFFSAALHENYADHGDSGAPLLQNQKVVAIMTSSHEKCETLYGDDYSILNTATVLNSTEALDFLKTAFEVLSQP